MLAGYSGAVARFESVRHGTDGAATYVPLFEALNWAASIDEQLGYLNVPELQGLRHARNCVHHQWADALELDTTGLVLPTTLPTRFLEWRWREQLPAGKSNRHEKAYRDALAGEPARFTLDAVAEHFKPYSL